MRVIGHALNELLLIALGVWALIRLAGWVAELLGVPW
jgi:hypothetical protein